MMQEARDPFSEVFRIQAIYVPGEHSELLRVSALIRSTVLTIQLFKWEPSRFCLGWFGFGRLCVNALSWKSFRGLCLGRLVTGGLSRHVQAFHALFFLAGLLMRSVMLGNDLVRTRLFCTFLISHTFFLLDNFSLSLASFSTFIAFFVAPCWNFCGWKTVKKHKQ